MLGSWTPRPRKDRPLSPRIVPGIESVAATITYDVVLGRMCRTMTRRSPSPAARAARTNSSSRMLSTRPRMIRASPPHPTRLKTAAIMNRRAPLLKVAGSTEARVSSR